MPTRKLLILTGVFAALLAFVVLWERHQPTSEERAKGQKRLLSLDAGDVESLLLERPDQQAVELRKTGGRWVLAGPKGGAADAVTADGIVADLGRLDLLGETRDSFDPKEYGLDAPKAKVTLRLKGGVLRTLLFGGAIPGADATAAAVDGRLGAVKFAPLAQLTRPYDEYRSKNLVDVPSSEITRITVVRGPNRVAAVRDGSSWRLELPVADLASGPFVDRLLADLAGVRASEFPTVAPADLPRVGLSPPSAEVVLEKGGEVVARLAFGAEKADAAGKLFASRDGVVVVVDDRAQESLGKELSAFREGKLLPLDTWLVTRVAVEGGDLRAGAEKVEGTWTSAGREVDAKLAEDLLERVSSAEVRRFVAAKDLGTIGLAAARKKAGPSPAGSLEVLVQKAKAPLRVELFAPPELAAEKAVAARVTGRGDTLVVDASVLSDLLSAGAKLKAASVGARPADGPAPAGAKPSADAAK